MQSDRNDSQNLNELSLVDLPPEVISIIPATCSDKEAIQLMNFLSQSCRRFHGIFQPQLEKQAIVRALRCAAYPTEQNTKQLLLMLEANPELLLIKGDVCTPAGIKVKSHTIYEFLLGSGDVDLRRKVTPFFAKLTNGENERKAQFLRYKSHIEAMQTEMHDDLTELFEIIKKSTQEDVAAELLTGDEYDLNYRSQLREALNQFREKRLHSANRIITEPRMHCNYYNLIDAYEMLDFEFSNLVDGDDYSKLDLVARQIIGFIQLTELTGYDRCVFASGELEKAALDLEVHRSFAFQHSSESFPIFDRTQVKSRTGVGFDSFVAIDGSGLKQGGNICEGVAKLYKRYIKQKIVSYTTFTFLPEQQIQDHNAENGLRY